MPGERFNENKLRYDLIPQEFLTELAKVFTYGAEKYGVDNWRKGLSWRDCLASAKRHLEEFAIGNDYNVDDDPNLLHVANAAANLAMIAAYYKIYPQGDDRPQQFLNPKKIVLDIDGVVFDFDKAYEKRFGVKLNPFWNGNYQISDHLKELESEKEFWLNLPILNIPKFEVFAYVTSRGIPTEWTMESLQMNGLPCAPVVTVPWNQSKVESLKKLGDDIIFVDDKFDNFKECTNAGIFTYLMTAKHNEYYNVGHRRIHNLENLI